METFEPVVETQVTISDIIPTNSISTKHEVREKVEKKEKKRLRHSNFVLMVNTNKPFADWDDPSMFEYIAKLKKRLEEFGTTNTLKSVIVFKKSGHGWTTDYIKKVDRISPVIERGNVKGCIHAHFRLNIDHWSCIQLDYSKIKEFFQSILPGSYIHIKRYYSDKDVDEYNNKNVPKVSVDIIENLTDNERPITRSDQ